MELTKWSKSTRSAADGNCVEIAAGQSSVLVRDSKNPSNGTLKFSRESWLRFIQSVKISEFDH
jgi:hypothetical protein